MKKKIVVSGISPGQSGVGRVLEYMVSNSCNINFVYPPVGSIISIKDSLLKFKLLKLLEGFIFIFKKYFKTKFYFLHLYFLKNKDVIVLHPQSLKLKNVERLVRRNNVCIYVMDNNFFCIKSYNYLKSSENPCFLCLNMQYNNAFENSCESFPLPYTYDEYFHFINFIKININKISFLTQNAGQIELLKKQFGANLSIKEIGLLTSDLFEESNLWVSENSKQYDIVFHGDNNVAKGSKYIFELASHLAEYSFLFPFESEFQEKLKNVDFIKMNWTTGLKSHILNSKLTLCPSIWSAPIEGSVLKTLNLGIALGVFDAEYSFGQEISNDSVLKLTGNVFSDVELIRQFISSENYIITGKNGKQYIYKKVLDMISRYDKIFKS
jgi:hypothetical protein